LPIAVAVHQRNYLALRPTQHTTPVYFVIDFAQAPDNPQGMATAYFMNLYALLLANNPIPAMALWDWVTNILTIVPPAAKRWLSADGVLHDLREGSPAPPAA
jgi:hypothetical protein